MQIDPTATSAVQSLIAPALLPTAENGVPPKGVSEGTPEDAVEISAAGRLASAIDEAGRGKPIPADLFSSLGDHNGDGKVTLAELEIRLSEHLASAQEGLKRLAREMGVDLRKVTIRTDGTGKITVEGSDPNAAQLQDAVNNDFQTRNALIGANNLANIQRIGQAAGMAQRAAASDPSNADGYYGWVRSVANQTLSMDMIFAMEDGRLSGKFETFDGRTIGITEGLAQSALAAGLPQSAIG